MNVSMNKLLWKARRSSLELDLPLRCYLDNVSLSDEDMLVFNTLLDYDDDILTLLLRRSYILLDTPLQMLVDGIVLNIKNFY